MNNYDASSIRILTGDEAAAKFQWKLIDILAAKFNRDRNWIERSIASCERADKDAQYFIDRYLKGLNIPLDPDVNLESKIQQRLLKEEGYYK